MNTKEITGIILAGGKSSRMGRDKGLLPLHGQPFVQHIINALNPLVERTLIITANEAYQQFECECYADLYPNGGPLGGIYTGLSYSKTKHNFVLSCDVPLVASALLEDMLSLHNGQKTITIAQEDQQLLPLIGLYHQACMPAFLKKIEQGKLKLIDAILEQPNQQYRVSEEQRKNTQNINTKKEYKDLLL